MRKELLEKVGVLLLRKGFTVRYLPRRWFDIVARKQGTILLVKALNDANSMSSELAAEMSRIGSVLSASPIIIAEKAGDFLEDDVVYLRFGVYTISISTFAKSLENNLPVMMKKNSGITVSIDGNRLSEIIRSLGFSISDVSRRMGVSRQMVIRYKIEKSEISVKKAEQMNRLFGDSIFKKVDIFSQRTNPEQIAHSRVAIKYENLGFRASDTRKAPFDIIAKGNNEIILTEVGDNHNPEVRSLTRLIDASNLVIFDKKKPSDANIPHISRESFLDINTAQELIKFLKEFD